MLHLPGEINGKFEDLLEQNVRDMMQICMYV